MTPKFWNFGNNLSYKELSRDEEIHPAEMKAGVRRGWAQQIFKSIVRF